MITDFPLIKLADCVDLLAGYAFKSEHFSDKPDDIALIKGENVSQGCILWEKSKRWSAADWTNLSKFQLQPGDVIVAMDRPWVPDGLKWAYIRKDDPHALLVQRCARLRSNNPGLDQDFLRFVIGGPGFEAYVRPITTGVNVPHISGKQILDYQFPLPPLPIQRRIADILSAYDELIENSQRRIKILEQMARTLYREWFVHFRFPGHEGHRFVSSPLGDIPEGWEVKSLGDICIVTDYVANGSFAALKENVKYRDSEDFAILVRGTDFNSGWNGRYVYVTEDSYRFLKKSELRPGDIVVTNVGNVGTTFLVPDLGKPLTLGPNSVLVRPGFGASFVFHYLKSDKGQHSIRGITSGSAQPKFNKTDFRSLKIATPTAELLENFDSVLEPLHTMAEKLRASCQNLRCTRDLLLPRLLSGQINVEASV